MCQCRGDGIAEHAGELQHHGVGCYTSHSGIKRWNRRAENVLLERRFKHPVISRSTIQAARALRPLQGRHGLYFSGQYTTGFDSQESAVYSAMKAASCHLSASLWAVAMSKA